MRGTPPTIVFVYRRADRAKYGSSVMRAAQLCEQVRPHLPAGYRVALSAMPSRKSRIVQNLWALTQPSGAFLMFTKSAWQKLKPKTARLLRRRKCVICFDYVDADLRRMWPRYVDVHLAASLSAQRELERLQRESLTTGHPIEGNVKLLFHNADTRLLDPCPLPTDRLRTVYFGSAEKVFLPSGLSRGVDLLDASSPLRAKAVIHQLKNYNCHYCVSPLPDDSIQMIRRPFTKGVTAAVMGANVIADTWTGDAVELLGSDYPYLVRDPSEEAVADCLDRAERGFGGAESRLAAERMRDLAALVAPPALARQLAGICREVCGWQA